MPKHLFHFIILQLCWTCSLASMEEQTWEERSRNNLNCIEVGNSNTYSLEINKIKEYIYQIKHQDDKEVFGFFLKRNIAPDHSTQKWWSEWKIYQIAVKLRLEKSIAKSYENPYKHKFPYETVEKPVRLFKKDDFKRITIDSSDITALEKKIDYLSDNNFLSLENINDHPKKNIQVHRALCEESLQEATLSIIVFGLADAVFKNSGLKYRNGKLKYVHFDTLACMGAHINTPMGICVPQILGLKFVEHPFSSKIIEKITQWNIDDIMSNLQNDDVYFKQISRETKGWKNELLDNKEYDILHGIKTRLETLKRAVSESPHMAIGEVLTTYFNTLLCPDLKALIRKGHIDKIEIVAFTHSNFPEEYTSEAFWRKLLKNHAIAEDVIVN